MHPLDVARRDERQDLIPESRSSWWILMVLVAVTILVVALVMAASGFATTQGSPAPTPSRQVDVSQ